MKLKKPLAVGVLASLIVTGGATAYFTSQGASLPKLFQTARLQIAVSQVSQPSAQNWVPGETRTAEWQVQNTGTVPVYLKGYFTQTWHADELSDDHLKVVGLERKVSENWEEFLTNEAGVAGEFFYSSDGSESELSALQPSEHAHIRATVLLDPQTPDQYQLQVADLTLHVAAQQLTEGATWPLNY